jgi:hypothetical protein
VTTENRALMPNERRYCIWQCPTHTTNQNPRGYGVKAGCRLVQFRKANPTVRSQGKCKNCSKKPQLSQKEYLTSFPLTREGKNSAIDYCAMGNRADIAEQNQW